MWTNGGRYSSFGTQSEGMFHMLKDDLISFWHSMIWIKSISQG